MFIALLFMPLVVYGNYLFWEGSGYDRFLKLAYMADIIYLGEVHDSEEVHELQIRLIRDLYFRGFDLLILMEQFQQPYQEFLDQYIEGEISEEEMLKGTRYSELWGYDPELYAGLWRFARVAKIPLYALNIPSSVLIDVRRKGIFNVKSGYLPPFIVDFSCEHRRYLEEIFRDHPGSHDRLFDIQLAWDNGMAYRVAKLFAGNPAKKVVVIVGSGHVWRGYGIPERVSRFLGDVRQLVLFTENGNFYFLFSRDFSRENSSANSIVEPNCNP